MALWFKGPCPKTDESGRLPRIPLDLTADVLSVSRATGQSNFNGQRMKSVEGGCGQKIVYGTHAEEKFAILKRHGETLRRPEKVDEGFRGRKVAQRKISASHVLRVVYEEKQNEILVVTFYPGRRSRYESSV